MLRGRVARVPYQSQGFWFILAWKILLRGVEKVEQICNLPLKICASFLRLAFVSTTFSAAAKSLLIAMPIDKQ